LKRGPRVPRRPRERTGAWTVLLVPPRPGERLRQLRVSTRAVAFGGALTLALVAGAATWTGETTSMAASTADRLAESQRTVVALLDSVQALRAVVASERASRLPPRDMVMPVSGRISSRYATSRLHPVLDIFRAHRGVDVAAPRGSPIVSPAAGRVRFVGWRLGYGLTVEIEHSGGVVTRLAHCREARAKAGDRVNAGDVVATVGTTGLTTGPHVHFEVFNRGKSVDPIQFLASTRSPVDYDRDHGGTR
jgi:murein DD-endopeptidase MepM/ murein hydrolase activator NlpD